LRRVIQYSFLFIFVAFFVWSRRGGWPGDVVNLAMRLEPLAMLTHMLASRTFLAGSALALVTVGLTLVAGRAWCGWLCPMGTVLDLVSLRRWRRPSTAAGQAQSRWRGAKYGLLLIILFAAGLTSLTLLIFDPLSILFRTLSIDVWPGLDQAVSTVEGALYQIPWLSSAVSSFDGIARPKVLPPEPVYYRYTALFAAMFAGIVLLNLVAERFWCRYLCPLGGSLGLLGKVGLVRRRVNSRCVQCDACAKACPTGTIDSQKGYASDSGECTMCLKCHEVCPADAHDFSIHRTAATWSEYNPSRRQALVALGVTAAGVAVIRSDLAARRDHPLLIQPPGARENGLLSRCIRCGQCIRACPTSAIQPAITEAGLEGLWTPVLVPRLGYCDYSCNACGGVCPVQAVPPLPLEEKRKQVVGLAYIDKDRCIPWADGKDCIVCEEMCPIPSKAIVLQPAEVVDAAGKTVTVKQPSVIRERCNGCGICEYKCPLNGESAIRVYAPGFEQTLLL